MNTPPQPAGLVGLSLMIVDDNPVVRIATAAIAARLGIATTVVASGEAAIESLRRHPVDAVLIDLRLPGLDGIATTLAIRGADAPWAAVPVLGMTATVRSDDAARCAAAGIGGLLAKPVLRDTLEAALTGLAGRRPDGTGSRGRQPAEAGAEAGAGDSAGDSAGDGAEAGAGDGGAAFGGRPPAASERPRFDPDRALGDLRGNRPALDRMIRAYLSELPALLTAVDAAARAGDPAALARLVHRLRGGFAVLHAEPARRLAVELEHWLDERQVPPARQIDRLASEARRLADALHAWRITNPI